MTTVLRFATYILASQSGTLYIGMTNNLRKRVWQHAQAITEGFSKKYGTYRLVYFEEFQYVQNAIRREKQLKGWRREKKVALLESKNPKWLDLSREWYRDFSSPRQPSKGSFDSDSPSCASRTFPAKPRSG